MKTATVPRRAGRPRRDAGGPLSGDTRETILIAAAKLFSQQGYNGVRLYEIAQAAGVSAPAIYYYFADKQDILKALSTFSLGRTLSVTRTLMDREMDPGAALFIVLWFHASRSMMNQYDLWYEVQFAGGGFSEDYAEWRSMLVTLIGRGVELGVFRDVQVSVALSLIIGSIYGIKELEHTEGQKAPEAMAEFVIRGLARTEAQADRICLEAAAQRGEWEGLIAGNA